MTLEIRRPRAAWRAELLADLRAVGAPTTADWSRRPSILRRVAVEVARLVPAEAAAIRGHAPGMTPLLIAVALETGLPVVDTRGEDVVVIADTAPREQHGALAGVSAFGSSATTGWRVAFDEDDGATATKGTTMDTSDLASAIARVTADEPDRSWIDLGKDPQAARLLAEGVAADLRGAGVDAVVGWRVDEDIVLAQLVAEVLGLQRWVIEVDEGLLTPSRPLPRGARVGWVTVDQPGRLSRSVAEEMLSGAGAVLVTYANLREVAGG